MTEAQTGRESVVSKGLVYGSREAPRDAALGADRH